MLKRFKVLGALAALAVAFTAVSAFAQENNVTGMKIFTVTEKTLGGTYSESVEIRNISGHDLGAGTLQIEFPSQVQLLSSNPGASMSGNTASIMIPFLAA